jgi:hypothetical protein
MLATMAWFFFESQGLIWKELVKKTHLIRVEYIFQFKTFQKSG